MPSVAADPHDPTHLVVAYLDYALLTTGYAGVGVAVGVLLEVPCVVGVAVGVLLMVPVGVGRGLLRMKECELPPPLQPAKTIMRAIVVTRPTLRSEVRDTVIMVPLGGK